MSTIAQISMTDRTAELRSKLLRNFDTIDKKRELREPLDRKSVV